MDYAGSQFLTNNGYRRCTIISDKLRFGIYW